MDINSLIQNVNFSNVFWLFLTPIFFMLADIISGFIQAVINNNVDSQKMREGLWRKLLLILVISLTFVIQMAFNIDYLQKAVSIYIVVMELVSIFENLKKAGINLGKLGDILKVKPEENSINLIVKKEVNENDKGN